MNRAHSIFEIKSFDDDQRTIEGIASTPEPDRMGDVVIPTGAKMSLPLPFLYQHNARQPIGHVVSATVTGAGIAIKAQIAKGVVPFIDEAWALIKAGLIRGLSIGFRPLEDPTPIKGGDGYRFDSWELMEISAVTIPAQAQATILTIKAIDEDILAASGRTKVSVVRIEKSSPGASGHRNTETKGTNMKTTAELIAGFEAKRQQVAASMATIMEKAADAGVTLDVDQKEQYDGAAAEIKEIDEHIARLKTHEAIQIAKATSITPVAGASQEAASNARGGSVDANGNSVISVRDNLQPGIKFARYVMCLAQAEGRKGEAAEIAKMRYPDNPEIAITLKAAVTGGTTTDATWAAPLITPTALATEFIEFLRPQTIIGKFGANGIPNLRRVPFNIKMTSQTSGGSAGWVGEGAPKPLTKFDFANVYLTWTKIAAISVITDELARFSTPSAEQTVRDGLSAAVIERMDIDFVDPAKAAVAGVSPASITNGVTGVVTAGNEIGDIVTDVNSAFGSFVTANLSPTNGVWIMSAMTALRLSMMFNALGQKAYPDVTITGGKFAGLPVIVSQYVPTTSGGAPVILLDASEIFLADDGQVAIDVSREASLQMLDNPTNNSATATATTMVSMFQTNSLAIRAERYINWQKRRAASVAFVAAAKWGQPEA